MKVHSFKAVVYTTESNKVYRKALKLMKDVYGEDEITKERIIMVCNFIERFEDRPYWYILERWNREHTSVGTDKKYSEMGTPTFPQEEDKPLTAPWIKDNVASEPETTSASTPEESATQKGYSSVASELFHLIKDHYDGNPPVGLADLALLCNKVAGENPGHKAQDMAALIIDALEKDTPQEEKKTGKQLLSKEAILGLPMDILVGEFAKFDWFYEERPFYTDALKDAFGFGLDRWTNWDELVEEVKGYVD